MLSPARQGGGGRAQGSGGDAPVHIAIAAAEGGVQKVVLKAEPVHQRHRVGSHVCQQPRLRLPHPLGRRTARPPALEAPPAQAPPPSPPACLVRIDTIMRGYRNQRQHSLLDGIKTSFESRQILTLAFPHVISVVSLGSARSSSAAADGVQQPSVPAQGL